MWRAMLGGAIFCATLFVMFPTDALVRAVLGRITPSGAAAVVFRQASLRPWGLRLDEVAVRRPDGTAIVTADRLTLRPSLRSLLRPSTATGELLVQGATWLLGDRIPALEALHADPALVSWRLDQGSIALDRIDLRGPEVEASGTGTLRLASGLGVEGAMTIVPASAASPVIRDLLASLPPAQDKSGARLLAFTGTVGTPRVVH
jgi:hypothetical protein